MMIEICSTRAKTGALPLRPRDLTQLRQKVNTPSPLYFREQKATKVGCLWPAPFFETVLKLDTYGSLNRSFLRTQAGTP